MADASKQWDRSKPFKRINNDAFRPAKAADGLGAACGCQIPADFPDLKKDFDNAFKDFKPPELQKVIQKAHTVARGTDIGLTVAAALATVLSGGALAAAAATAKKLADIVNDVLDATDKEITKLLQTIGEKLMNRAIRVIPQWVPVLKGASNDSVTADQIIEVEGLAKRSFMNAIDVPFRQWHLWFNWNIYIAPEPGYENALSPAPNPPNTKGMLDNERPIAPEGQKTIEVQWDSGALGDTDFRTNMEKGFALESVDSLRAIDGVMLLFDWAWPQATSYVWAAGRWVYDCSRTTNENASTDQDNPPKMCAMLNPCKAIATARWQGFKFRENELAVPAIQFMFFTCKRGGYIDHPTIRDQDYEFIVDLPPIENRPMGPFPIGNTGHNFPHNTIVLRPRLLKDVDQTPFRKTNSAAIDPIVEVLRPADPTQAPSQVKVRVPLTGLPADAEACGFILSMGWFDPTLEQAKKVKHCSVAFTECTGRKRVRDSIVNAVRTQLDQDEKKMLKDIHDKMGEIPVAGGVQLHQIPILGDKLQTLAADVVEKVLDFLGKTAPFNREYWLMRLGVNGRWRTRSVRDEDKNTKGEVVFSPPQQFDVLLALDDLLSIAVNGADFDPVGDLMRAPVSTRFLKIDGNAPIWSKIVEPDPDPAQALKIRTKMAIEYVFRLLSLGTVGMGLAVDNQPLGFLDPQEGVLTGQAFPNVELTRSPISISRAGNTKDYSGSQAPLFARAIEDQKILVEDLLVTDDPDSVDPDYTISYNVTIEDQKTQT